MASSNPYKFKTAGSAARGRSQDLVPWYVSHPKELRGDCKGTGTCYVTQCYLNEVRAPMGAGAAYLTIAV